MTTPKLAKRKEEVLTIKASLSDAPNGPMPLKDEIAWKQFQNELSDLMANPRYSELRLEIY